jgi:murein DD-endopeptidase MepM/ murein hydrolase activator NlpD
MQGDTLTNVARRFSVNVGELAQLNHIGEHAPVTPGQQIGLPSSMRDTGPVRDYSDYATNTTREPYRPPSTYHVTQVSPAAPPPTADHGANYATPNPPVAQTQAPLGMTDAQIAQAAHGRFVWPVRGNLVARFGPQGVGRRNDGVDISAASGTPVKAAASGEVVYAGDQVPGFGNLVLIKHADGWVTAYAHLDTIDVQMRQQVSQGQAVGTVGASGGVTAPELHFEVRYAPNPEDKAKPVDPIVVLPSAG